MEKYLIVGLGNPRAAYDQTRHNVGFEVLDTLAKEKNLVYEAVRYGEMTTVKLKGRTVYLLKPNTFVNLSGKAVRYWGQKLKIKLDNLLVLTDDLGLPYGTIRLRAKGSSGGHNGLKSIEQLIETPNYARLRIGIGSDFQKGGQVDYVLGKWTEQENKYLDELMRLCVEAIHQFVLLDVGKAMSLMNSQKVPFD